MAEVEPLPLEVHWKIGSGFWGAGIDSLTTVQAYFTGHTRQCTTCSTNSTINIEQYILY